MHDSLLRTLEMPQDTPPGHYRKEARLITLNHQVELATPLVQVPRGGCAGRCSVLSGLLLSLRGRKHMQHWAASMDYRACA